MFSLDRLCEEVRPGDSWLNKCVVGMIVLPTLFPKAHDLPKFGLGINITIFLMAVHFTNLLHEPISLNKTLADFNFFAKS